MAEIEPVMTTESKYAVSYFSSQISTEENKDLEITVQQDEDNRGKTLTCKTRNGLQWVGQRDAGLLRATRLLLLARCRRTGVVSVASAGTPAFRFLPACVLDSADAAKQQRKRPAQAGTPAQQQQQQKQQLYEEFGSAAKKRRIAEAKRLNASVTPRDLKAAAATAARRLERAASATPNAANTDAPTPADPAQALLPPRDPSGASYAPNGVCPAQLRTALLPEAERLAASGPADWEAWRAGAVYPDALVLQRLPRAPAEPAARLAHCVRLAMLACMRRFYSAGVRLVNRKGPLPDLPEEVAKHLLDGYTEKVTTSTGQHRALTHQVKDRQLVHMIVLCLQLDGYTTDTAGLMTEFRLTWQRLSKLLKVIGCQVITEKAPAGGQPCRLARIKPPAGHAD